jgi:Amt family ammonium transporter
MFEEMRQFNSTLQTKVDIATTELKEKVELLEEARRKETDLMDIMGHELRTPATIAKLNSEMLEIYKSQLQAVQQEGYATKLHRIRESIDNEIRLINTLLLSAKLEGSKLELNKEEVDVINAITMSIHGNQLKADAKNLKVTFNVPTETEFPSALADKARFQEITDNLIGNAIKYTPSGSVTVNLTHDANMINFEVIDTGIGIKKELLPKLGRKFYRVEQYIKDGQGNDAHSIVRPGGTGLGLFVVFGLVKAHGGEIKVESEEGKGSKFSFSVPIFKETKASIKKANEHKELNVFKKMGLKKQ